MAIGEVVKVGLDELVRAINIPGEGRAAYNDMEALRPGFAESEDLDLLVADQQQYEGILMLRSAVRAELAVILYEVISGLLSKSPDIDVASYTFIVVCFMNYFYSQVAETFVSDREQKKAHDELLAGLSVDSDEM